MQTRKVLAFLAGLIFVLLCLWSASAQSAGNMDRCTGSGQALGINGQDC